MPHPPRGALDSGLDQPSSSRATPGKAPQAFPPLTDAISTLSRRVNPNGQVGLVYLSVGGCGPLEERYGWKEMDSVLSELSQSLRAVSRTIGTEICLAQSPGGGDDFLCFLPALSDEFDLQEVQAISNRLEQTLSERLQETHGDVFARLFKLSVGYTVVRYHAQIRFERLVSRMIKEALLSAEVRDQRVRKGLVERLRQILEKNDIRAVYQPIVDLADARVVGYEGLARGPKGTDFELPHMLFTVAIEGGLSWKLESLCHAAIFQALNRMGADQWLFVNTLPSVVENLQISRLNGGIVGSDLPRRVVLEITEREAIKDFARFSRALDHFKAEGFRVAIDDFGCGYSSLEAVAHLKPNFVKLDRTLVEGIAGATIKREMTRSVAEFARKIDCGVIAEGIESEEDRRALQECGIVLGQGYLFARPSGDPFTGNGRATVPATPPAP